MNIERICDVDHHTHFNLDMEYFTDTCERECILQLCQNILLLWLFLFTMLFILPWKTKVYTNHIEKIS